MLTCCSTHRIQDEHRETFLPGTLVRFRVPSRELPLSTRAQAIGVVIRALAFPSVEVDWPEPRSGSGGFFNVQPSERLEVLTCAQ
jgi:hypothetical protein